MKWTQICVISRRWTGYRNFKKLIDMKKVFKCARLPYYKFIHYSRPQNVTAIPYLSLGRVVWKLAGYFKHENIEHNVFSKSILVCHHEIHSIYNTICWTWYGSNHAVGGLNSISKMEKVVRKMGAKYAYQICKSWVLKRRRKKEKPAVRYNRNESWGIIVINMFTCYVKYSG